MSTNKLGDEFLKVPKLDASGKDWPSWKARLELSLVARGLSGYLNGMKPMPSDPAIGKSPAWIPTTPAEQKEVEDYEKDLAEWIEKDAVVRQQIAVTIPNSLFIHLISKSTAKEYYDVLKGQFEQRSLVVSVELEKMISIREDLASMGRPVTDEDMFNMIFVSLPRSISATTLISLILDEYDHLVAQSGGKAKSKDDDVAFTADSSKRNKGRKPKFNGDCNNCGWTGHMGRDCWEEGGGKAGQAPKGWKSLMQLDKAISISSCYGRDPRLN